MSGSGSGMNMAPKKTFGRAKEAKRATSGLPKTHSFLVNAIRFTVDAKYQPEKGLGRGAYGVVCSALDKDRGK
jgi:hypothetical protein